MTFRAPRLGLDIGGTKTHAVVLDTDGRVLAEDRVRAGWGGQEVHDQAVKVARRTLAAAGLASGDLEAVGVGIPGAVDHRSGTVVQAVNLGLDRLPLAARLGTTLGATVHVENDVNAAALGLLAQGAGGPRGTDSLAYLNLGTGLAAGIVLDGELWRGAGGAAGEIGHVPVDPAGPPCGCGMRGCLETFASGSGLATQWRAAGRTDELRPARLAQDAVTDPVARRILDGLHRGVAAAVRLLVLTVDVDAVVLGGGIARLGADLLAPVTQVLRSWEAESGFLASVAPSRRVSLLRPDGPVAAIGAALLGEAPSRR
ncbi:MAG TPA: sugar kinase [Micrococcales bacterium]|uniref:ROK family protein n=1 Tax=Miniimonas arenae TaxID=676201 RepID=UPI000ECC769E|nr:ROK family protein [Miniimonas arenae]HCX85976.1 sugar kinase [Micrococcales bacterium]